MSKWKHWRVETDADNLAWLTFDRADSSTNTFSSEALRELAEVCVDLAERTEGRGDPVRQGQRLCRRRRH